LCLDVTEESLTEAKVPDVSTTVMHKRGQTAVGFAELLHRENSSLRSRRFAEFRAGARRMRASSTKLKVRLLQQHHRLLSAPMLQLLNTPTPEIPQLAACRIGEQMD
jgi:hypothetical protein